MTLQPGHIALRKLLRLHDMAYRPTTSSRALSAIRLSISHLQPTRAISTSLRLSNTSSPDTSPSSSSASLRPTPLILSREELHRLHRLSALDPPAANSPEERELLEDLGALVGLMDMVKDVELPKMTDEEVGRLLAGGVGSVEFDGLDGEDWDDVGHGVGSAAEPRTGEQEEGRDGIVEKGKAASKGKDTTKRGRELLEYATNRRGDYYMSRKASPPAES